MPSVMMTPRSATKCDTPPTFWRDQFAVGVDQRGAVVAHLVDHHVVGGALQVGRHLVGDGGQRVADHFERDRVERMGRHHAPPTVMISSPDGATVQASCSNSTVVVPCSWISAGPAISLPAPSSSRAIDRAGDRLARVREIDLAPACRRRARDPGRRREAQLRALADHRQPDVDHLDRLVRRMVCVAVLVERVEGGADRRGGRRFRIARG